MLQQKLAATLVAAACVWGSAASVAADTINLGTILAFPGTAGTGANNVQGNVYWNDASVDATNANIGYYLTGTGAFSGGTNFAPANYLTNGSASGINAPTAFNFVRTSSSLTISLLAAFTAFTSGANSDILGWYATDATGTVHGAETAIYSSLAANVGTSTAFNPTSFYGFYVDACVLNVSFQCTGTRAKYYTNTAFNTLAENIANHQHFAAFGLANLLAAQGQSTYFIGSEDTLNSNGLEAYGDFNDVIFRVVGTAPVEATVPEPATMSLMGSGLVALTVLGRRRMRRKMV